MVDTLCNLTQLDSEARRSTCTLSRQGGFKGQESWGTEQRKLPNVSAFTAASRHHNVPSQASGAAVRTDLRGWRDSCLILSKALRSILVTRYRHLCGFKTCLESALSLPDEPSRAALEFPGKAASLLGPTITGLRARAPYFPGSRP